MRNKIKCFFIPYQLWKQIIIFLIPLVTISLIFLGLILIYISPHLIQKPALFGIIIIFTIFFIVTISLFHIKKVFEPIHFLIDQTKKVAQGIFETNTSYACSGELGELLVSFNQMVETLKQAKQQEKLAIIGKTATEIVHDLKNSVSFIHTFIQIFPENYNDPKFIDDFINLVPEELNQWLNMLEEITDFTKQSTFELKPIDLREIIYPLKLIIEEKIKKHNIQLKFQISSELLMINGNFEKLKRVLMNLILNAIEAMPQGGYLVISLNQNSDKKIVEIKIKDSGKGISQDMSHDLFEPFSSTKQQGLGLGLNICKEIVLKHGGDIFYENNQNQGTIFTLQFPLLMENIFIQKHLSRLSENNPLMILNK